MQNSVASPAFLPSTYDWSNRILIASVAGILFLTLLPFRFDFAARLPADASPFLLARSPKLATPLDAFLNTLLFIPFGFGLSEKLRHRGMSPKATLPAALVAGALLSYGIEFIQIYIPSRDSGWEDVFTNSIGAVIGSVFSQRLGRPVLLFASRGEEVLNRTLTLGRLAPALLIYFALWFTASVLLQRETRLSNWDPECQLLVGNEASGRLGMAWKGEVSQLQFWDRALPEEIGLKLTAADPLPGAGAGPVADFDFSNPVPLEDRRKFLPTFSWAPAPPAREASNALLLDGKAWLTSKVPVSNLVKKIEGANQFAVRVRCTPTDVSGPDRRIVSISRSSGITDLTLRADNAHLVFWFRNPISVKRSFLAWYIPNVFAPNQPRDILFSYDGSTLSLYIDGKKEPRTYLLGPGTGLAQMVRRVIPGELEGYSDIYYAIVFLPAGVLIGIAFRRWTERPVAAASLLLSACLAPVILEYLLVAVSGRAVSRANVFLSLFLIIAGALWINADRRVRG